MSKTRHKKRAGRRILAAAAGIATVGALVAAMPAGASQGEGKGGGHGNGHAHGRTVDVQLLSFNDLHGNLEPPAGSSGKVFEEGNPVGIDAGGVGYLDAHLRKARQGHPYSITAAAGDMVGASPLISGLFHDEPTIEALGKLGLDVTSVGNHEFDEGAAELARLQNGGCHPTDGCAKEGVTYPGADFPFLGANVTSDKTGKPVLDPTFVWEKNGVRIGFIGVTLEGTANIVNAAGIKGLTFRDEVETINKYAKVLERKGVKSIVALIHEGGLPVSGSYDYDCDSPGPGAGISGPIVDIAKKITPQVDALVTGHTHQAYACTVPDPSGAPRTVTSAASFGRLYTDTTLTYDRRTKDIVRTSVSTANHVVTRDVEQRDVMKDLVADWKALAAPIANRPVGHISADIKGYKTKTEEAPLGNLIADAQLEAMAPADKGGAEIAFMNPGGIRADFVHAAPAGSGEGDGVLTYGEVYTVQPFTNMMTVQGLTGEQIVTALRQQVSGGNEAAPKYLQVSKGFTYTLDLTKTGADRVDAASVRLNGEPLDPARTYRVAMNEFLSGGGDGFAAFAQGKDKLVGASDLDVLVAYLAAHAPADAPLAPPALGRINVVR
ncbi:bifunctional metallophosphatase/5'-nucleotidase [Streptomyces sp. NPDC058052]|uniref:bifunctional metallophosphatase/5'-nucleotidase n=1 Tax=Streptomyces sp. NPDC058052 TaxID=3346316 RepID=UPI0036E4C655